MQQLKTFVHVGIRGIVQNGFLILQSPQNQDGVNAPLPLLLPQNEGDHT